MKAPSDPPDIHFSQLGRSIQAPVIVDLMDRALANPELLSLAAGFTDNSVLPLELVGRFAAELTQAHQHNVACINPDSVLHGSANGTHALFAVEALALDAAVSEQAEYLGVLLSVGLEFEFSAFPHLGGLALLAVLTTLSSSSRHFYLIN